VIVFFFVFFKTLQIPFLGHRRRMIASIETYFYTEHQLEFIDDACSTLKEKSSESKLYNTENVENKEIREKSKTVEQRTEVHEKEAKRAEEDDEKTTDRKSVV